MKGTRAVYTLVLFLLSVYTNVTTFLFILDIYSFLKCGALYVNSATGSFYIGDSTNSPVEVLTVNSGPIDVRNVETFCGLTLDEIFAKAKEEGFGGGGGSVVPELPDRDSLTLGNTITWASNQWIVSHVHVSGTEAYLTLKGLSGDDYAWTNLQSACNTFADQLSDAQKACLKSVAADNIYGKVFVATYDQMHGGFSYFNSDSRRNLNKTYWTSTKDSDAAYYVNRSGYIDAGLVSFTYGFRPSVCIDLTLYNT